MDGCPTPQDDQRAKPSDPKLGQASVGNSGISTHEPLVERFKVGLVEELARFRPDIVIETPHKLAIDGPLLLQPGTPLPSAIAIFHGQP